MPPLQSKGGKQVARDYPMSEAERAAAKKSQPGKAQFKLMLATKARNGEIPSGGLKKSKKGRGSLQEAAKRRLQKMTSGKKNGDN